jgi:hypothetical protein
MSPALAYATETVPGEAERRRTVRLRADDEQTRGHGAEDQRQDRDRTPRYLPDERGCRVTVNHREPPFEEGPGGPLAGASGLPEEVVEVVGRPRLRDVIEDRGEPSVESIAGHHAGCPPGIDDTRELSSAPTAIRIATSDRCRRDLAVPSGTPSMLATSGSGMPRK